MILQLVAELVYLSVSSRRGAEQRCIALRGYKAIDNLNGKRKHHELHCTSIVLMHESSTIVLQATQLTQYCNNVTVDNGYDGVVQCTNKWVCGMQEGTQA